MKVITGIAICLTAVALCQCAKPVEKIPPQPAFDVTIVMTPAAVAKLQSLGDHAVVDSYYYGFPKPGVPVEVDAIGRVRLGNELYDIKPTDTKIRVSPADMEADLYAKVTEPYAQVTVESRTKENGGDEVLECSSYHGKVASAAQTGVTVNCDVQTTPN